LPFIERVLSIILALKAVRGKPERTLMIYITYSADGVMPMVLPTRTLPMYMVIWLTQYTINFCPIAPTDSETISL